MNYHVRKQGVDIGFFPLEELKRRRASGEFTGAEYVQGEGMNDWQPLDLVLQPGYQDKPPPLSRSVSYGEPNQAVIWIVVGTGAAVLLLFVVGFVFAMIHAQRNVQLNFNQPRSYNQPNPESIAVARKPIVWSNTTQTVADSQKRAKEFATRQWIDGYEKRGRHNPECDAEADQF